MSTIERFFDAARRASVRAARWSLGENWSERAPFVFLFVLCASVYYASHYPIAGSVEGSHFSLVRAIVEEGSLRTDSFWQIYSGGVDYATKDGHYYIDRAPGVAFLGVPFYALGRAWGLLTAQPPEVAGAHALLMLPACVGALGVLLLIRLCRSIGASPSAAWTVGLLYAFASLNWKYSAHLYVHVFEIAAVLSLLFMVHDVDLTRADRKSLAFAFLVGALPMIRYPLLLLIPVFFVMLVFDPNSRVFPRRHDDIPGFAVNVAAFAIPILVLAAYHTACFGAPWLTFRSFNSPVHMKFTYSMAAMFDHPFSDGAWKLLFQLPGHHPVGLFVKQPYLWLAAWGWWWMFREHRRLALGMFAAMTVWLVQFATYHEFDGGSAGDARYIMLIAPMLMLGLALWIDRVPLRLGAGWREMTFALLALTAGAAFFACLLHFAEYFGHDMNWSRDIAHRSLVSRPALETLVRKIFISADKIHWLWVAFGLAAVFAAAARKRSPHR
ncbi:MAG: hypothetical protein IT350_18330 [Deltaproteobacteria bacterium]|nr:hypothetical protein [Deltaproteobacteria bacterium]